MADIKPYKIRLSEELLENTKAKLKLARLDDGMGAVQWNDLEIGHHKFTQLVEYWRDTYDWRKQEDHLNTFNNFKTDISVDGHDDIDLHFLWHKSSRPDAIPLLFVHGWPGSFMEALRLIPLLTEPEEGKQAFHVVAPSIPGYGFSSYSKKAGFGLEQHAECFAKLMQKLGYDRFVCQGGDWGSIIVRYMAYNHPDAVIAIHINMLLALPPDQEKAPEKYEKYQKNDYSEQELKNLDRTNWFSEGERGYQFIQETKPVTLGYALHDSPVGMLAWFVGKLKAWTDDYPWTEDELINWAFIHYQYSPSAAMHIYKEAGRVLNGGRESILGKYVKQPVGGSLFPKELWIAPKEWMEEACNVQFWHQHSHGGHFAAWECPEAIAEDLFAFYAKGGPVFGKSA